MKRLLETPIMSFLRSTLEGKSAPEEVVRSLDWSGLKVFAAKQAIVGVVYEGVKLCRQQYPELVEKKELLSWFYATDKKRRRFAS